ncbi:helix-turn-helix domain-containing protein [Geodermatophilus sp. DSM 45219]|uniref:helix-turn-helix domain-containing protein n=1 Tax=Geodermatophilus sp. DSM 45219 TaxID=1881103 RepID=UPI00088A5062|nr:helix-turn-helix domain-containing protein [Geodermatophilus sp. DSM 45219]SDO46825.1 DNA binding domain-containing protein, excisionase family [Geodermatophilus sp. DSM 45219]
MLTVGQAAERLGVGPEQVRRLIRAGKLAARKVGRTLVLDDDAVDGRARLPITAGRVLAPRTAWAALWQLSGEDVDWLPAPDRSRLVARIRCYDAERLVAASRDRAERCELRVLPAYRQQVLAADGVVPSGLTAAAAVGADIVAAESVDEVYCSAGTLAALRRELGLSDRGQPNLVVRVPRYDRLDLTGRAHMPTAVVAVDLAESAEVRTRRAGLDMLAAALSDLAR